MLIIALGFIWFFTVAKNKITESQLKQHEMDIHYQKEMLLNTVKTKEIERSRIAKELHDDVSSQLGVINLNLFALKNKVPQELELMSIIDQISNSLKSSTERARTISHELMPLMFKKFGIHDTFREFENNINLAGKLKFSVKNDYLIMLKDEFKLLHIYRIIQELTNNTIKYGHASNVSVVFSELEHNLILTYTDDGIGFDSEKISAGLGISNIKTRVSLLEGEMEIISSKGNGHTTIIKFPNND